MTDVIHHTLCGENLAAKAVSSVFKAGNEVLPQHAMPTAADRKKINESIDKADRHPDSLLATAGEVGHYMPDHAVAMSKTAATAIQYLKSQRPVTAPQNPLDPKRQVSASEQAAYDRKVNIAQQPLIILDHIVKGTLTASDVEVQRTLYPQLYQRTVQKLNDSMAKTISKGETIPYKTRLGLSLYMGQALDSTMKPEAILSAQPKPPQNQQATATTPASNPKRSVNAINKLPGMYKTSTQRAEEDRKDRE